MKKCFIFFIVDFLSFFVPQYQYFIILSSLKYFPVTIIFIPPIFIQFLGFIKKNHILNTQMLFEHLSLSFKSFLWYIQILYTIQSVILSFMSQKIFSPFQSYLNIKIQLIFIFINQVSAHGLKYFLLRLFRLFNYCQLVFVIFWLLFLITTKEIIIKQLRGYFFNNSHLLQRLEKILLRMLSIIQVYSIKSNQLDMDYLPAFQQQYSLIYLNKSKFSHYGIRKIHIQSTNYDQNQTCTPNFQSRPYLILMNEYFCLKQIQIQKSQRRNVIVIG